MIFEEVILQCFFIFCDFSEMQGKVWNFHPLPASTAGKAPDPFYVSEQDESHTVKCRSFTSSDEGILRVFSQHTHKVACSSCAMHIDHVSSDGLLRPQNEPHPHISLSQSSLGPYVAHNSVRVRSTSQQP